MLLPLLALVFPVPLGGAGPVDHVLMMLAHVAMIAGMVVLMVYRQDRYTHGAHGAAARRRDPAVPPEPTRCRRGWRCVRAGDRLRR